MARVAELTEDMRSPAGLALDKDKEVHDKEREARATPTRSDSGDSGGDGGYGGFGGGLRSRVGTDADERLSISSTASSVASVVAEAIAAATAHAHAHALHADAEALPSPGAPGSLDFKTVTFTVAAERRLTRENSRPLFSERKLYTPTADKLVVVMVGLPARGKSFIAKKLWKFFCWKGFEAQVFNVGQLRRAKAAGGVQDHTFFDPNNAQAKEERERLAVEALEQLQHWFIGESSMNSVDPVTGCRLRGDVAIYDATNSTKKRRRVLLDSFEQFASEHKMSVHVVFVESICTSEAVINANIHQKVTSSPDYRHMKEEEAIADLKQRMKNYEAAYEALEDAENVSYIKLFDLQSKVHAKGMYVGARCRSCCLSGLVILTRLLTPLDDDATAMDTWPSPSCRT